MVESLTKRYGDTLAVTAVSFVCAPGTVTGFVRPTARQSTTLRAVCGVMMPTPSR